MTASAIVILATALITSVLLQGILLPTLRRQVMDIPNQRSSHTVAVPRGGGVAVTLAVGIGVMTASPGALGWTLVAVGFAFAALGLAEDLHGVGVAWRLGIQVALGGCFALWLILDQTSERAIGLALLVLGSAVWVSGFTNTFNFMDGIDGISGVNAIVAGGWFGFVGYNWNLEAVATVGLAVAGAAGGFLAWNIPRAQVFLGDTGSYALGAVLACTALMSVVGGVPLAVALGPLVIYLSDATWTLSRRLSRRGAWHAAHREHVYQRLVDAGAGHVRVSILSGVAAFSCCISLTLLDGANFGYGLATTLLIVVAYLALPRMSHAYRSRRIQLGARA